MALKACSDWLLKLRIFFAIYLREIRAGFVIVAGINELKSSCCTVLSHCCSINENNFPLQCLELAVDTYQAASQVGKDPPVPRWTAVNYNPAKISAHARSKRVIGYDLDMTYPRICPNIQWYSPRDIAQISLYTSYTRKVCFYNLIKDFC